MYLMVISVSLQMEEELLGPSFKCGYGEKRKHCLGHIVKVKYVTIPFALTSNRIIYITVFKQQICTAKKKSFFNEIANCQQDLRCVGE